MQSKDVGCLAGNIEANRKPTTEGNTQVCLFLLLLVVVLITGCIPLGPRKGREQVVASRSGPDESANEKIVGVPTEHHWMLLIAPDGPEMNYVLSETWRFYLVVADGRRHSLPFLKQRGNNPNPWRLLAPISHTNLWVVELYTGSLNRVEHGHHDARVICFNAQKIVTDAKLDYPEDGEFKFDTENHILTYQMQNGSRR